ncbi:MAG: hypothetical protein HFI90_00135 [Clostridia bacterium]|nr:hypothetical protein [Clostridia bacterium]
MMNNQLNEQIEQFIQERYAEAYEAFQQTPEYKRYKQRDKAVSSIIDLANPKHSDLLEGYFSSLEMLNSLFELFLYRRGFSDCLNYLKILDSLS